jgi:DUF4097 and DUF4098 domain-containing protein YvlB
MIFPRPFTHLPGRTLGILSIAAMLSVATPAWAHHLEKHFAVRPHPVIIIHNPSGTITVQSWQRAEVQVMADHASRLVEVDATQKGNLVDMMTHLLSENVSPEDLRADYQITVPEDSELQIHNDAGSVAIFNVVGDTTVDTYTAGVVVHDVAGYLTVRTVSGSVECVRCAGRTLMTSFSGNLHLAEGRSTTVRAATTSGNIFFDNEFLPSGTYELKNYSGTIEMRFSPGDSFALGATSRFGKVNSEARLMPPDHSQHRAPSGSRSMFGTFNQGTAHVELLSFNGTINIRKRE